METRSIWLATELTPASAVPFEHAFAIAAALRQDLTLLHVHDGGEPAWDVLPDPRKLLVRWGRMSPEARAVDYNQLGFRVHRHGIEAGDEHASLDALVEANAPDLLVMGHRRSLWARLFDASAASRLAHRTAGSTLVVPEGVKSLLGAGGYPSVRTVVVPVGPHDTGRAVERVVRLCEDLGRRDTVLVLAEIGPATTRPELSIPESFQVRTRTRLDGPVLAQLLEIAEDEDADLIAMETHGEIDWWEELVGSRPDRLMNRTPVPVLLCHG